MSLPTTSPSSGHNDQARAFLQSRVAFFWKAYFAINVLSVAMGAVGAIAAPGMDHLINVVTTLQCGLFWWLSARGQRSIQFSRFMDAGGLLLNVTMGALLGRYFSAQFAVEQKITTVEGAVMADSFIAMVLLGGVAMVAGIRAAVIPSLPRRTALVTAMIGVPVVLVASLVAPATHGALVLRDFPESGPPWLPIILCIMWGFTILTSTIISHVIYGLRAEVREAKKLGQYVLEQKIGEGGMGEVYRAHHGMMRRPSAIKLLPSEKAGEISLRRFEREVQLTARLTHPNTITIFDYGRTEEGIFYYAMELLDGATLQRVVEVGGPQPPGRVRRIMMMACGALSEAHAIGLIHRDIKPANIMLCQQGGEQDVLKVLDFGLVKELTVDGEAGLSNVNTMMGTPRYMAPESIRDPEAVDARADIYALGAVAYFLLTSVPVFEGTTVVEICAQHLHEIPRAMDERGASVPVALETLVRSCLEKDPALRPQSTEELKLKLQALELPSWGHAEANAWWELNRPLLQDEERELLGEMRTIAVAETNRETETISA